VQLIHGADDDAVELRRDPHCAMPHAIAMQTSKSAQILAIARWQPRGRHPGPSAETQSVSHQGAWDAPGAAPLHTAAPHARCVPH
jgi:hypothetical protein